MEQSSHQRDVRLLDPTWSVSELMARIAKALVADGPALTLSPISAETVASRIALIVTTTGSTGVAKEVGLTSAALIASAKASNKFLGAEFGATWSLALPLNHIAGINVLIRSLESGTSPINVIGLEGKYPKVDFTSIVPTQLYRALHGDENLLQHLQSAQKVLVGGAPLTPELRGKADSAGITIVESYGSTETSGGCIYDGTPLEGVEIDISESGRLAIKGKVLAHSYLNTNINLVDENGWFISSDFAHLEGSKVIVDGRIDDVVITGGEKVSLVNIERAISQAFPEIQFAIFAVDDVHWGQAIHCAIVGSGVDEGSINHLLNEECGPHAKIKGFIYCEELPLIGIGKVDRAELARRL
jgi:O-succinylbenzoic acid--CoA ligase